MLTVCSICGSAGRACGDDHMAFPPISSQSIGGMRTMTDSTEIEQAPQELKEYEYFVGHAKMTAQLTEEHAQAIGASPVGTLGDTPADPCDNKNAQRLSSQQAKSDEHGVNGPDTNALDKARDVRNRRA
jgi:hypothetical protein